MGPISRQRMAEKSFEEETALWVLALWAIQTPPPIPTRMESTAIRPEKITTAPKGELLLRAKT
jgi:hypothetical protein